MSAITNPRVHDILDEIDGGSVLDIGCVQHDPENRNDPNWLHQHLYKKADRVLGVDIDEDGIRILREDGYNVEVADAEALDMDEKFDYIVAGELIEHLENPGNFLNSAKSRLKEDGKLIISTPNPWCWPRLKRLVYSKEVHCNPEHTHYYDRRTLRLMLERYGFTSRIQFVGPMSEGITRRLYRIPITQFKRLGAPQLLAVAKADE